MKDSKKDSASVLERFGRDKRKRSVVTATERVERRPRMERPAYDPEQPLHEKHTERRASYNPHFTSDNRPRFEKPHRTARGEAAGPNRSSGERPFFDEERSSRSARGGERPRRMSDSRGGFERHSAPKRYGDNSYGGYRAEGHPMGERGERRFSERRAEGAHGDRRTFRGTAAERSYGDRSFHSHMPRRDEKPRSYPKFNPDKQIGEMRLNRFLAQSGLCSRREADDFITAGVVSVNGVIVTELGTKVMPTDEVRFNDEPVHGEKKVYLVLNKPKGYVTSLEDPHADKTVMELVKGACEERIYPVGRLDKNSVGLLLFTNDGDLTKQLTHPSYQKKKIYQVTLDKPLTRADMDKIADGITLEDGEIYADEISYVKENKQEVGIEIHSGRNRIVRRIFEFLGYTVQKLDRVYYAGITKKNLKRGAWRFLTREEVERLKSGRYE